MDACTISLVICKHKKWNLCERKFSPPDTVWFWRGWEVVMLFGVWRLEIQNCKLEPEIQKQKKKLKYKMCAEMGWGGMGGNQLSLVHTELMGKCELVVKSILNSSPSFHFYYLAFGGACIDLTYISRTWDTPGAWLELQGSSEDDQATSRDLKEWH